MIRKVYLKLVATVMLLIMASTVQSEAQPDLGKCVANIAKRIEDIGAVDFDLYEFYKIVRKFDFGNSSEFVNQASKKVAFERTLTSLSEFIDLSPNLLSGKGMRGYSRFSGGIIRSSGADFVDDLKRVFGGLNFDGPGFNKVMEQLDGTGTWKNQTDWQSPGGLTYGIAPNGSEGHRISHLFNHTVAVPGKPMHSIFSIDRKDLLALVDEGWGKQSKYHPTKPDGTLDNRVWIVDMGRPIGTAGETHLKIVVDSVNPSELTTAHPFIP